MKRKSKIIGGIVAAAALLMLAGCAVTPDNGLSDADKVEYNLKMEAEEFNVQRTIIGQSGITDDIFLYVEGRCSFEYPSARRVDIICKKGPDEYTRDTVLLGDNDRIYLAQEGPIDASVYHSRVIFKPESILPEFDISVGQQ